MTMLETYPDFIISCLNNLRLAGMYDGAESFMQTDNRSVFQIIIRILQYKLQEIQGMLKE